MGSACLQSANPTAPERNLTRQRRPTKINRARRRWRRPPPTVPAVATQGGEARTQRRDRWAWTEPAVWTERMLQALEEGVKGGKWFSLMDKVYAPRNLAAAFAQVKRNKGSAGVDHVSIAISLAI